MENNIKILLTAMVLAACSITPFLVAAQPSATEQYLTLRISESLKKKSGIEGINRKYFYQQIEFSKIGDEFILKVPTNSKLWFIYGSNPARRTEAWYYDIEDPKKLIEKYGIDITIERIEVKYEHGSMGGGYKSSAIITLKRT